METQTGIIHNVSVDCAVFGFEKDKLKVLLIEQKEEENTKRSKEKARFALPGDLVHMDESLHEAASRILKELTQVDGIYLKQFHTYGDPQRVQARRDTEWLKTYSSHPEARIISVAYYSLVNLDNYVPGAGTYAKRSVWVEVGQLPQLAFDHNRIVDGALEILREEIVNKDIGFSLLPEKFTLTQLQIMYESVLDKKLDKRNFRKSIKKIERLKPLNEKQKGVLHKPARLYRYENNF